jgi:hypothetical protein
MKEENGPFIALLVFVVGSLFFGFLAYSAHTELYGETPDRAKDEEIKKAKLEIQKFEDEVKEYEALASALRLRIREQQNMYYNAAEMYEEFGMEYKRRQKLVEWAESFDKQAVELQGTVSKLKSETLTRVNKETTEVREKMEKDLQEKNQAKEEAIARLRKSKEDYELDVKKYRSQRNYEQSGLDESKSVLTDLTQREVERANEIMFEADGKVILADPVTHMVIINIGTAAGVKNGYRFECYALRPGNKKVFKAWLEVRRADPSKSECLVVQRPVLMPKDPLSSYVAKDPEEIFSPYQESGKQGFSAQTLSGAKTIMLGANKEDPIVEGDVVQNPFYAPNKTFTFYIAGSKELQNERQKSAIRYRWTEIKNVIEFYGGKVVPVADTSVDYVIAQKNPKTEGTDAEKADFQKAVDLGLPVIYEWELFRFLESK